MSFVRPTLSALIERIRGDLNTRLPGADSRLRHSVLDVLGRALAGLLSGLYGYLDYLARQLMPDTAEGAYLRRWASIWGVFPKAATAATATVTATGTNGSTIAVAQQLQRADGRLYAVTTLATIAAGTATVSIAAVDAGAGGAVEPGMILTFTGAIAGVAAQTTVATALINGSDEELDPSLTARLLDRIQQPPQGGNAHDYQEWALAQAGVTRAWVYPGWTGPGTVGVTFVMDARPNIIPLAGDIAAVQTALDILRPVTADLLVFAPTAQPVDYQIVAVPNTAAVQTAIRAELADFHAREAEPGGILRLSRIDEAISLAEGETSHEVIAPAGDPVAGPAILLTLGNVTFL